MPTVKLCISPAQGLLILLQRAKKDSKKYNSLKKKYLSGAETSQAAQEIQALMQNELSDAYDISYQPQTINKDASRRYFETHLAYETLKKGLSKISIGDLKEHYFNMLDLFDTQEKQMILAQLEGKMVNQDVIEYSTLITSIEEKKIFQEYGFNSDSRQKIILLAACSYLGLLICNYIKEIPYNEIYHTGFYLPEQRGRKQKINQEKFWHHHRGVMQPMMPLSVSDIAWSKDKIPFLKPSDKSTYTESTWVRANFKKMVHPFSNSISGTMLAQLRVCAYFKKNTIKGLKNIQNLS